MNNIARVIQEAGGVSALAGELKVKPPTVHQWKSGDRKVSPRLAIAISNKWPGLVTVHDLRPDVFGAHPLPNNALPIGVPNGEHPVRDANDRDHVLGAGRSK